jgi:acetylornithine/succinyldiaminopimelate/putrescine aminotransferase
LVAEVANAVLDVVLGEGFLAEVRSKGDRLRSGLEDLAESHDAVAAVRGRGLMAGLVLHRPEAADLVDALRGSGLLVCPAGAEVVRFVPPLTVTTDEIDEALDLVGRCLSG